MIEHPESQASKEIGCLLNQGCLVPDGITCTILLKAMEEKIIDGGPCFIIDGYPRNQDNLDGWERHIGSTRANVLGVFVFNCPEQVCIDRCLNRGRETSGRSDDNNEETIKKRLAIYNECTMPIISQFKNDGKIMEIDSSVTIEQVFEQVEKALGEVKITFENSKKPNWISKRADKAGARAYQKAAYRIFTMETFLNKNTRDELFKLAQDLANRLRDEDFCGDEFGEAEGPVMNKKELINYILDNRDFLFSPPFLGYNE